jgi:vanillate O-demethylase ferredoxin subunit
MTASYFDPDEAFEVRLSKSGRSLTIEAQSNILDVLLLEGVDVAFSCMSGMCGSCRASVLQGTPDHRDEVLTNQERSKGDCIILCCSRSKTPVLILDL